jgi:hypothetical protein
MGEGCDAALGVGIMMGVAGIQWGQCCCCLSPPMGSGSGSGKGMVGSIRVVVAGPVKGLRKEHPQRWVRGVHHPQSWSSGRWSYQQWWEGVGGSIDEATSQ